MKGKLSRTHNQRDHRIRWVCQLVLKSALMHQTVFNSQLVGWQSNVPDSVLTSTAAGYVEQLLTESDYLGALQVAMLIPTTVVRKRIVLEIMARLVKTTPSEMKMQTQICERLGIPINFYHAALALKMQSGDQFGQAVDCWLKCGNSIWAESVYSRYVLPN